MVDIRPWGVKGGLLKLCCGCAVVELPLTGALSIIADEAVGMESATKSGRNQVLVYWISTVVLALEMTLGGVWDVLRVPQVREVTERLGYPDYFLVILGVWKLLGAIAVIVPRFPRLKEWAYAGFFFDLSGAAMSHAATGDPVGIVFVPLVLLVLIVASWALQPARGAFIAPKLKPAQAV